MVIEAASGFRMKLPQLEDLSWKDAPDIQSANTGELSCAQLIYMIDQVQFCIELESARNYGAVGYLHRPEDGKVRLVAPMGSGFLLRY